MRLGWYKYSQDGTNPNCSPWKSPFFCGSKPRKLHFTHFPALKLLWDNSASEILEKWKSLACGWLNWDRFHLDCWASRYAAPPASHSLGSHRYDSSNHRVLFSGSWEWPTLSITFYCSSETLSLLSLWIWKALGPVQLSHPWLSCANHTGLVVQLSIRDGGRGGALCCAWLSHKCLWFLFLGDSCTPAALSDPGRYMHGRVNKSPTISTCHFRQ